MCMYKLQEKKNPFEYLSSVTQTLTTFKSRGEAVSVELFFKRCVFMLKLLQVLRQATDGEVQSLLLPLGAFTFSSANADTEYNFMKDC